MRTLFCLALFLAGCKDKSEPPAPSKEAPREPSPDPSPAARKPQLPKPVVDTGSAGSGSGTSEPSPLAKDEPGVRAKPNPFERKVLDTKAMAEKLNKKKTEPKKAPAPTTP